MQERAIGKVLCMKLPIKTHKGGDKGSLFVNKQLFWLCASITLDNNSNNDAITDFSPFFTFYTLPHTSDGLTSYYLKYFDPYDNYAACCVPLIL